MHPCFLAKPARRRQLGSWVEVDVFMHIFSGLGFLMSSYFSRVEVLFILLVLIIEDA